MGMKALEMSMYGLKFDILVLLHCNIRANFFFEFFDFSFFEKSYFYRFFEKKIIGKIRGSSCNVIAEMKKICPIFFERSQ